MARGVVKWFNVAKGFGFIEPEDGGKDVFVHISVLEQSGLLSLEEGQTVEYEIRIDNRGQEAVSNLVVASGTHGSGGGSRD